MRQIKFRGRRLDNGQWVEGNLVATKSKALIMVIIEDEQCFVLDENVFAVDPATVGQFTGLLDKNGKEIYEGDVLQMWLGDSVEPNGGFLHRMYVVFTTEKGFVLWGERMILEDAEPLYEMLQWKECKVVGNIHSNPELLKTE